MRDYPFAHLMAVHRPHFQNMSHALRPHGVTPQMWRVLAVLNDNDGHSIGYLARYAATERSNLSRILDTMEAEGLIDRRAAKRDKRFALVHLTRTGKEKFAEILPVVMRQYRRALVGFTAAEVQTLVGLLNRIEENVGQPDF